jgi:ppGpp synthetase/RelA/SpoT-type nucleotidyltranferase
MTRDLLLKDFLIANNIDELTWKKSNIGWTTLQEIAVHHQAASANLENSAEFIAKAIQKFNGVHSVRWRVKDSDHLLEKIIRKRAENNPKYSDINLDNYFEIVTDLVGVRALHLFKEDCFGIDAAVKSEWTLIEKPIAYIRLGDSENLRKRFETEDFEVMHHPKGYRSVHYVIETNPSKRRVIVEIQVRTIFEEGWSEIDHKVRYPNFSDNEQVKYFLEIFNRMSGSADDMGGFVLGLVATLRQLENEIAVAKNEKDATFKGLDETLNQLESVKKQDKASRESIAKLKAEIEKLKERNTIGMTSVFDPYTSFPGPLVNFGNSVSLKSLMADTRIGVLDPRITGITSNEFPSSIPASITSNPSGQGMVKPPVKK